MDIISTQVDIENVGRVLREADDNLRKIYSDVGELKANARDRRAKAEIERLKEVVAGKDAAIECLQKRIVELEHENKVLDKIVSSVAYNMQCDECPCRKHCSEDRPGGCKAEFIARARDELEEPPVPAKPDPFPAWRNSEMSCDWTAEAFHDPNEYARGFMGKLLAGFLGDDATNSFDKNLMLAGEKLFSTRYGKRVLCHLSEDKDKGYFWYWDVMKNRANYTTTRAHAIICGVYEVYKLYKSDKL